MAHLLMRTPQLGEAIHKMGFPPRPLNFVNQKVVMNRKIFKIMLALGIVTAVIGVSAPAMAASFSTYISGWIPTHSSRVWNKTAAGSTTIRFTGCSVQEMRLVNKWGNYYHNDLPSGQKYASAQLRQNESFRPDINKGTFSYTSCFKSASTSQSHGWSNLKKGSYHLI